MKTDPIVKQLRDYAPIFERRVSSAFQLEPAENSRKLTMPCAWVVFTRSEAEETSPGSATVNQELHDYFSVFVLMPTKEETGKEVIDLVDVIREQLFLALVGWTFEDYSPIEYDGGGLDDMDRAFAVYRFDFRADRCLGRNRRGDPPETWQDYYQDGLPPLKSIHINVDFIDPANPRPGPDGQIDAEVTLEFSQ